MKKACSVQVNGLEGPRCTLDVAAEWTTQQVKEAIQGKIGVPVTWQRLLKDSEKLADEVTVGSLLSGEPSEMLQLTLLVEEVRPIHFIGQRGLQQLEPGHLRKTGGANGPWLATAVSSENLVVGQGRGLRFRPGQADKEFMLGLGSQNLAPSDYNDIEYAAHCSGYGHFDVYESGAQAFAGCSYSASSVVELRVSETEVHFLLDGDLKYSGQLRGQRLFHAMASFSEVGAEALEIQWL